MEVEEFLFANHGKSLLNHLWRIWGLVQKMDLLKGLTTMGTMSRPIADGALILSKQITRETIYFLSMMVSN